MLRVVVVIVVDDGTNWARMKFKTASWGSDFVRHAGFSLRSWGCGEVTDSIVGKISLSAPCSTIDGGGGGCVINGRNNMPLQHQVSRRTCSPDKILRPTNVEPDRRWHSHRSQERRLNYLKLPHDITYRFARWMFVCDGKPRGKWCQQCQRSMSDGFAELVRVILQTWFWL